MADDQPKAAESSQADGVENDKKRRLMEVRQRSHKKSRQERKKSASLTNTLEPLFEALEKCSEGEELRILCHFLQPNPPELYEKSKRIWTDLMNVLTKRYQDFEVHPFGSSFIGLAFKTSDFDFYVQIEDKRDKSNTAFCRELASALEKSNIFRRSIAISAKVPIVKTIHRQTGFSCDINFTNALGVCNSNFIQYVLTFDYRIHPMLIVIKFWAQCHMLSGTGRLSNYCIVMMVFFYLQILDPQILPPVCAFQGQVPEMRIGFWNVAFDHTLTSASCNTMTVCDLLTGFFNFYNKFDFAKSVICPLYGRTYTREQLATDKISGEFQSYIDYLKSDENPRELKLSSPVCVQDPFDLGHNIAGNITEKQLANLKATIKHAVLILQECAQKSSPSSVLLMRLFGETVPKPVVSTTSPSVGNRGRYMRLFIMPEENMMTYVRMHLSQMDTSVIVDEDLAKKVWVEKTHEFLVAIMEQVFCVTMTEIKDDSKLTNSCRKFSITGDRDVWVSRKHIKSGKFLNEEIALSKKLYENCKEKIILEASCTIHTTPQYQLRLTFDDECTVKKSHFMSFFSSVSCRIRRFLNGYFSQLVITESQ